MTKSAGNALLSVYDKSGIEEFARQLHEMSWAIYASGGTAKAIAAAGIPVIDVVELVGGEAILGHRVVTLSREIHAGILADTADPAHMKELRELNIPVIDLVCVDMYPLEEEIAKDNSTRESVTQQTDIGGPTMIRAAAKGRRIVLSSASQRKEVVSWLKNGKPDADLFVEKLAAAAEYESARYIMQSALYLQGETAIGFIGKLNMPTKYGENPQQNGTTGLYADKNSASDPLSLANFDHVQGMEKSHINTTDIDRLLQTVTHVAAGFDRNFGTVPYIAVGVKHGNACGAAVGDTPNEAIKKMLEGDTRAIFGGVVMINGEITEEIAETLMHHSMDNDMKRLLDGVIGSSVGEEALEILSRNKLRVIVNPALAGLSEISLDHTPLYRQVRGGYLKQPNYTFVQDLKADGMQQYGEISEDQKRDMILGWAVGSTSNSNTITIVKNGALIGNGVGQQDRVGAGQLAITRTTIQIPIIASDGRSMTVLIDQDKLQGAVAYSDSFFPFPDGPMLLSGAGVKAILTSSGSRADETVVAELQKAGVAVMMVPDKTGRGFYMH